MAILQTIGHNLSSWVLQPVGLPFFILKVTTMMKNIGWVAWLLIGSVLVPLGNFLGEMEDHNAQIFGSIFLIVGAITSFFGIYGLVVAIFMKITSFFLSRRISVNEGYQIAKKLAVNVILLISVWLVSYAITVDFILSLALAILSVYIWSKVSNKYLADKNIPRVDNSKEEEALESIFSDEIKEEEAEFAERLDSNDMRSGSKSNTL